MRFLFISLAIFSFAEDIPMKHAPCGSWKSPITAESIASAAIHFSEVRISDGVVYWLERRPLEQGRTALMAWSEEDGEREVLPREYNLRTRVHEYGGGALLVDQERIFFIHDNDRQIYRFEGGKVDKITAEKNSRFADMSVKNGRLFCVLEEHGEKTVNSIAEIGLSDGSVRKIAAGADFYSSPRISPDGKRLAYVSWNLPNMPWDGSELWTLDLETGKKTLVAGGPSESVSDPCWSPSGKLHYVSDASGWWNLYSEDKHESICPKDAEFTLPQWIFGRRLFGFVESGIFTSWLEGGFSRFGLLQGGALHSISLPYTSVSDLSVEKRKAAGIGSSPEASASVFLYDLDTGKKTVIKTSRSSLPQGFVSKPQAVAFPSKGGRLAHAFYYPPTHPDLQPMPGEKPPLLIHSHGGPTAFDPPCFSANALYWTSRGVAYATVNYGGSTGYGRAYRDLLKGQWGIVDIEDCTEAARYLVSQGLADPERIAIEGGSSGGYTTLEALSQSETFQVGADHFGVSDLERLALDTHKFESRYLDQLVGAYPEERDLYIQRSPLSHADRIKSPVIIFQGEEDAIVPPSQSEAIYQSLLERGIPTAYLLYPGEQHGFRKAENIRRTYEAQLYFFSKVLGFPLNEKIEPVDIKNL